jgi:hypothetical protein
MRMRHWGTAVAVIALTAAAPTRALAQPAKGTEPTVEVRVQSVNVLLDKAEYVGGLLGKEDVVVQVKELVKTLTTEDKGIEGIDPKKPFGVYATLVADVANSPAIVMIPIADQKRFLAMLKDRLSVEPEKADGGTLKAALPLVNEVYFKFANGYLYAARDAKHLDAKYIIDPKVYFANDDGSVASAIVRIDRIPNDLKTFVIGQLEHQAQEALKKQDPDPLGKKVATFVVDQGVGGIKTLLDDGKQVSVKLVIDPKTDELSVNAVLTAKDGSTMAKNIAALSGKTSLPAGITAVKDTVAKGSVKIALPAEQKEQFGKLLDDTFDEVLKKASGEQERELLKKVFNALAPTAKAGELDAAFALSGPDAKGKYRLIVAGSVKKGDDIETLAKELTKFVPGDAVEFKFDVDKVGEFSLHKVTVKANDPQIERVFGAANIWIATSADCYVVSVEPDGVAIKAALKAKAVSVPVLSVEVSVARVIPLAQPNLKPDEIKAMTKDAFGNESPSGKDTLTVTVTGGKELTAKAVLKGKALRFVTALEPFKIP